MRIHFVVDVQILWSEQQIHLVVCAAKEERVKAQQARKQRRLRGGMPEGVHLWPMLHQPQPIRKVYSGFQNVTISARVG